MTYERLMPARTKSTMSAPQSERLDVDAKHRPIPTFPAGTAIGMLALVLTLPAFSNPGAAAIATAEVAVGTVAGPALQDKIRPIQICQPIGADGKRRLTLPCEQTR